MQVWDNDLFSPDDFIGNTRSITPYVLHHVVLICLHAGTLDLNLLAMAEPARDASVCSVDQLPELGKPDVKLVNLFEQKRLKGWWPVFTEEEGVRELTVSQPRPYMECVCHIHGCGLEGEIGAGDGSGDRRGAQFETCRKGQRRTKSEP